MDTPYLQQIAAMIREHKGIRLSDTRERYNSEEALPLLCIENEACSAVIALQGSQLLEFSVGGVALLWLSPNAQFAAGQAVRGGIPVCLPWFGVNRADPSKPKHGFVRNSLWQLNKVATDTADTTRITLSYQSSEQDKMLFPHDFHAELSIELGQTLSLSLSLHHQSDADAEYSWALHSYHPVESLNEVRVEGLDDISYLDNTDSLSRKDQQGAIRFEAEVDRVYESVSEEQRIQGSPALSIQGQNCETAIVWNPGAENASNMNDVGTDIHQQFICVERGAAFGNSWQLAPDERRTAHLKIALL